MLTQQLSKKKRALKPTLKAAKSAALDIYKNLNTEFHKVYKTDFSTALTKIPELHLTSKPTAQDVKENRREKQRTTKSHIEQQWESKDCDTMLATRQSLSQRSKQRRQLYFESHDDAGTRTLKRKADEEDGLRKPKRHCPSLGVF